LSQTPSHFPAFRAAFPHERSVVPDMMAAIVLASPCCPSTLEPSSRAFRPSAPGHLAELGGIVSSAREPAFSDQAPRSALLPRKHAQ
jgi:hypothetical protein